MKSFTVESILGVHHEKTLSAPVCTPVQHDVISQHHSSSDEVAAIRQQQLNTDSGSFCQLLNIGLSVHYIFLNCDKLVHCEKEHVNSIYRLIVAVQPWFMLLVSK